MGVTGPYQTPPGQWEPVPGESQAAFSLLVLSPAPGCKEFLPQEAEAKFFGQTQVGRG